MERADRRARPVSRHHILKSISRTMRARANPAYYFDQPKPRVMATYATLKS